MTSTTQTLDRAALTTGLRQSRDTYLRALENITDAQSRFRCSAESWCILEIAEHVATAERQMLALWTKLAAPGTSDRAKDAGVIASQKDRGTKRVAPERSRPSGRYATLTEAIRDFETNRANTISWLENTTDDLRAKVVEHPLAKTIDGVQLMLLMSAHAERHAAQIGDIMQHPGYPK